MEPANDAPPKGTDFIRRQVVEDLESGRYGGRVVTRFPPEPNGYLHVGHASAICLNFGIAEEFGGRCHLRFDDTNPETESEEYVRAIQEDIRWLGFDWGEHLYFASDYFERMYECAEILIRKGLAYVDSQPMEAIRAGRGTVTEPGVPSPYRERSVEENLDLFRRMRAGEFEDGAHVLRGKIDMSSPNMLMRDPVFYRIRHAHHYRQGDDWCIYPLYDYAHCLEDAFEDITHSVCTLEFDNNRELYDWVLDNVGFEEPRPHQYEWAGLDLENAVLSKRFIRPLVASGAVSGWDDPRLATVAAYRRRGVPPGALRLLSRLVGVSKSGARTEETKLDYAIREVLNPVAPRVMAVLEPLPVEVTSVPAGETEELDAPYYPHDVPGEGSRPLPFDREVYIERSDFEVDPPKGFRRLVPGGVVRLRHAYVIRCDEVLTDATGAVTRLRCSVVHDTEGLKVKGTVHWVSARHALDAEVRLFDALLLPETDSGVDAGERAAADAAELAGLDEGMNDESTADPTARVNPDSLRVVNAKVEPSVAGDAPDTRYQFERTGYFWRDPVDSREDRLVFNRIVGMKSSYRPPAAVPDAEATAAAASARGRKPGTKARAARAGTITADEAPGVSEDREAARAADPELASRFERYRTELGVADEHADLLTGRREVGDFFEAALSEHDDAPAVAAWVVIDLRGLTNDRPLEELPFGGSELGRLSAMVIGGTVTRRAAKEVLAHMVEGGGDPAALVKELGLEKVSDSDALTEIVDGVLASWSGKVEEYRSGNRNLIGLFIGEVMKASGGAADPKAARAMLIERLEG